MKNQFIIRKFMKNKAVKCIVLFPDRRVRILYGIPKDNILTLKGIDKSFIIDDKNYFNSNGIPTYIYDINNVEAKNPYNDNTANKVMSPEDLDTAVSSRVAREIFEATSGGMDKNTITMILSVMSLLAIGFVAFVLIGKLDDINIIINDMLEKIKLIGGF